jgi:hypothetical protein
MACAALTVNVYPEATRYDFQILHAPVAGVLPHPRKDLLGIGHDYMVPNTAPWNNAGAVWRHESGFPESEIPGNPAATWQYHALLAELACGEGTSRTRSPLKNRIERLG